MLCDFSAATLPNGYAQLSINAPHIANAAPGHFVVIDEQFPCYVMGQTQSLEIIANPQLNVYLNNRQQLHVSPSQGAPLNAPIQTHSYLLIAENDNALSGALFYLKKYRKQFKGLVLLGSNAAFPFAPCPSRLLTPSLPADVIAALPLFEDWGIPSRLASLIEAPGVYEGRVTDLAQIWLVKVKDSVQKLVIPAL